MRCIYFKWKISGSIDDKSEMSSSVSRHLRKCSNCREFYRTSLSMGREMAGSGCADYEFDREAFTDRIAERIDFDRPEVISRRKYLPYNAIAAGILLLVLVLLTVPYNRDNETNMSGAIKDITNLLPPKSQELIARPTEIASLISDPYAREIAGLRKNAESAFKFALSCTGLKAERLGINIDFLSEKGGIPVTQ